MTLKRTGFKPPSKEKLAELQSRKIAKAKEKIAKATKVPKTDKNSGKVAKKAKKAPKKLTRKKLADKVWELCKQIIRARHGNTCYTCNAANLEGSNWHTGHGKAKGALPLRYKYDLRNLRPQCMKCNIHYGGMSDIFITKLEQEPDGLEFLQETCEKPDGVWRIKQGDTMGGKDATIYLETLYNQYKGMV